MAQIVKTIKHVENYLQVKPSGGRYEMDGSIPVRLSNDGRIEARGLFNIISDLLSQSDCRTLDRYQLQQWLEYLQIYVIPAKDNNNMQMLLELNNYLNDRTYIIGQRLSLIDVAIYSAIYDQMRNFNCMEKERFINVSRWFDHLQSNDIVRQKNEQISFKTICLLSR